MLQVGRGIERWQREDDEQSWELRLPKGEIEGLKRFEKSHADSRVVEIVSKLLRCHSHFTQGATNLPHYMEREGLRLLLP